MIYQIEDEVTRSAYRSVLQGNEDMQHIRLEDGTLVDLEVTPENAGSVIAMVQNLKASISARTEKMRHLRYSNTLESRVVEQLSEALLDLCRMDGGLVEGRNQGLTHRGVLARSPLKVEEDDLELVPSEWKIKQPDKLDKRGILAHFVETGEEVPGVLITRGEHLRTE